MNEATANLGPLSIFNQKGKHDLTRVKAMQEYLFTTQDKTTAFLVLDFFNESLAKSYLGKIVKEKTPYAEQL